MTFVYSSFCHCGVTYNVKWTIDSIVCYAGMSLAMDQESTGLCERNLSAASLTSWLLNLNRLDFSTHCYDDKQPNVWTCDFVISLLLWAKFIVSLVELNPMSLTKMLPIISFWLYHIKPILADMGGNRLEMFYFSYSKKKLYSFTIPTIYSTYPLC